jgi:hypothetical protein
LIVYEGCDENCEFFLSPDFRFLGSSESGGSRRSNSDCELESLDDDGQSCYKPARSISDAQIPRLKELMTIPGRLHRHPNQVSITDSSSDSAYYLTDSCGETQSFSTSPQSVDSGLECYMDQSSVSSSSTTNECCNNWSGGQHHQAGGRFKQLAKTPAANYECDNSTDSTDSGVFSSSAVVQLVKQQLKQSTMMKRSAAISYTTDSEEDGEFDMTWAHHLDDGQQQQPTELSGSPPGEDEGELTPVLEVSRTEEFTEEAGGSQTQKKRRVMDEDKEQVLLDAAASNSKPDNNCWADCVDVRMIDFAHTTFSGYLGLDERVHWGPDNGYLLGLENLTDILSELQGYGCCPPHQKNAMCLSS